ncbi:MAG: hypothetical protein ACXVNF_00410 [Neobacillus sp.]
MAAPRAWLTTTLPANGQIIRGTKQANGCYTVIFNYQRRISENAFVNLGLGAAGAKQIGIGFSF